HNDRDHEEDRDPEQMQEDGYERSRLLRLHEHPRADNERDDRHSLARRSRCGATQRLRRERKRQDEERRPEVPERREVSRGHERTPAARRDIKKEKRERQELEADGRGQEQSSRKRTVAEAPRGEREAEREEIHVAEGHLKHEAEKEDVACSGPRPPERRKP